MGHAAGEEGLAAGEDSVLHGFGHEDGVLRGGDGGVHQDAVEAEFHGQRRVRRGAYARVHDQRDLGDELAEDAQVGGVLQAEAAADGRAERHDGGGARVDEAAGVDDVVGGVGQDGEALLDQDARGLQRGLNVRVERGLVADDLDLDPVGEADLAAEARGADGLVGGEAAGGVGQKEEALGIDEVEQRLAAAVEVDAAHGDGDHLRAGGFDGGPGLGAVLVLPCSNNEARLETSGLR